MNVRFERGALSDLEEIFEYVARDSPKAAARLVARIRGLAGRLAETPHIRATTRKKGFRQIPVGNYSIVYEIRVRTVIVQYVRHGARRRPWEGER